MAVYFQIGDIVIPTVGGVEQSSPVEITAVHEGENGRFYSIEGTTTGYTRDDLIPSLILSAIPNELKECPQWVVWRAEPRHDGKAAKIPYTPGSDKRAKANDPATWGTFDAALADYRANGKRRDGVGFELDGSGLVFVDLDDAFSETGELLPWAAAIVAALDSYTERSPGGTGLHLLARGSLPPGGNRKGHVEMYSARRYATMTGIVWDGRDRIEDRQAEIDALHARLFGQTTRATRSTPPVDIDDAALIERAMQAKNGDKFRGLWRGNWDGYPSRSEADLALCNLLAYWTRKDPEWMDRLFRQSGLYRSGKWERQDYREDTIDEAIMRTTRTYEPRQPAAAAEPTQETEAEPVVPQYGTLPAGPAPQQQLHHSAEFFHTDLGNAGRLVAWHGPKLHHCYTWHKWLVWGDGGWKADDTGGVTRMAMDTARRIYLEAYRTPDPEKSKEAAKHAMRSQGAYSIKAMLELAKAMPGIAVTPEDLDRDPWKFNTLNGTLGLRTGILGPHRKEDLITKLAPVHYDPDAECPLWLAFLARIMDGDQDLIGFLQRATGYSLTGDTSEQCFFLLWGTGANGKTTFLQAVSAMMGDYALHTPTNTLLIKRGDGIPNDVARLHGARLVTAIEADQGRRLAEALVKQLTGGDKLAARFLHAEWFEFVPNFKLWLGTNHKPEIRGTDWAIWRRIRLVPFNVTIPEVEWDRQLGTKLLAELDGILAWAVRGCLDWQRDGLRPPAAVINATNAYREESDPLGTFIEDCCILGENVRAQAGPLYDAYREWAKQNGQDTMNSTRFGRSMTERGFDKVRGARVHYLGIGLLSTGV